MPAPKKTPETEIPAIAWMPLPGPQSDAYDCHADVLGYGGASGGGKTDLALGKALFQHSRAAIFRRNGSEHSALTARLAELLGSRKGCNASSGEWHIDRPNSQCSIELCAVPNAGDETKYRGRPHDLLVFDEAAEFPEAQVRFLMAWLRSAEGRRCQALMCFNPPSSSEGRWIVGYFGPWLDPKHPNPAKAGELRWFAMVDGAERMMPDARAFIVVDGEPVYDFDPAQYKDTEVIKPASRTFFPAKVTDNPHLAGTRYVSALQALPEPLRSQMLYGDFTAGIHDDACQVIPTEWVDAAMERWVKPDKLDPMDSVGLDVARGGRDNTVIARRHGNWYDVPIVIPGTQSPDGPAVAMQAALASRQSAVIHVDVIGVGSSPYDFLVQKGQQAVAVNVAEKSHYVRSGHLTFANLRAELWWKMREALDPANNRGIALPKDARLKADLCAPRYRVESSALAIESREELESARRLGRSPDWASAYLLAQMDTPKRDALRVASGRSRGEYDARANLESEMRRSRM